MSISDLFSAVTGFFTTCFNNLSDLFLLLLGWALNGVVLAVGYTLYYIVDGIFTIITVIITAIDLTSYSIDLVTQIAGLPPAMLFLLHECGFASALSIIGGAYIIRLLLNLIPAAFTRI